MKPGAYTQLYVQLVFAVSKRINLLSKNHRQKIFEYVGGILKNLGHKPIIVNGVSDHIHILLGLNPKISISDTVHDLKRGSSLFINQYQLVRGRFSWQEGYGGFTYSRSQIENVFSYIQNQESHHSNKTFSEEYVKMLEEHEINYDSKYLFEFFDI